jgi:hypothetical protein
VIKFAATCLLTAIGLAAVLAIDDWLGVTAQARLLLIVAAAPVIAALIERSKPAQQPATLPPPPVRTDLPSESFRAALPLSELDLAIEHIQSIRVLLQVSASHNQPIPRQFPSTLTLYSSTSEN